MQIGGNMKRSTSFGVIAPLGADIFERLEKHGDFGRNPSAEARALILGAHFVRMTKARAPQVPQNKTARDDGFGDHLAVRARARSRRLS